MKKIFFNSQHTAKYPHRYISRLQCLLFLANIFVLLSLSIIPIAHADLKDFYFSPYSNMRRLTFVEDFYRLYARGLTHSQYRHHINLRYLRKALNAAKKNQWWSHPLTSSIGINPDWSNPVRYRGTFSKFHGSEITQAHHAKYRHLMVMFLNYLASQEYLDLGARYDRQSITYFNSDAYSFGRVSTMNAHHWKKSFNIARQCYSAALKHWNDTEQLANKINISSILDPETKKTIPFSQIRFFKNSFVIELENLALQIALRNDPNYKKRKSYFYPEAYPKRNYGKTIQNRLNSLKQKETTLERFMQQHQTIFQKQ